MPEYLAPGVYVEETSFRAKSIEGVSTSTAGFVGPTRYGPVDGVPELVTSFAEYERLYGTADRLEFATESESINQLALGVRAFFDNGGRRVYISRIYTRSDAQELPPIPSPLSEIEDFGDYPGHAWKLIDPTGPSDTLLLVARHPGSGGNFRVGFTFRVGLNAFDRVIDTNAPGAGTTPPFTANVNVLKSISQYDLVWVADAGAPATDSATGKLYWAERFFDDTLKRNNWVLHSANDVATNNLVLNATASAATLFPGVPEIAGSPGFASTEVRRVGLVVEVSFLDAQGALRRRELWEDLTFHPDSPRSLAEVFLREPQTRSQHVSLPFVFFGGGLDGPLTAHVLLRQLQATGNFATGVDLTRELRKADTKTLEMQLENGDDGVRPAPDSYRGDDVDPKRKTGLTALKDIPDISIVAAPGHTVWKPGDANALLNSQLVANHLISHVEEMRYRIAVLDSPPGQLLTDVRAYRAKLDSTRAALYYPFVRILDPVAPPDLPREINLPPSGFITGIYARNDVDHGVHKAPANEVIRGALDLEVLVNKGQQDVLNPESINVLRFFEGRGYRVWGARTITSDPEWKYVNVRRYFIYLEHSIDRGTQWAVFENNGDALWANVRRTVEDFLFNEWKSGHLFGTKPDEAYFVRCDRTTMTQNDFDNGRLVCLIGVSPLRPAEFVIFRIGQKTADARS
jgi:phage tail sheath protein FI